MINAYGDGLNILIIDDDEVDYHVTSRKLKQAFREDEASVAWIQDAKSIDYITQFSDFDICLIDQNLGAITGVDIIRDMHRSGCMVPMILLTGSMQGEFDQSITECGAVDFLLKDEITPTLLNRSIRFAVSQKKNEKKLVEMAYSDGLTGIANRKKFDEFMEANLCSSGRNHLSVGMLLIDLDDFKQVNDTYGHPAGDMLLQQVASRLKETVRETDLVARLGGDEFGIALTMMQDERDINIVLKKLNDAMAPPFQLGEHTLFCSASIGAVTHPLNQPASFQEMFRRADISLYGAKFKGKNTAQIYRGKTGKDNDLPKRLPSRIQNALANDEFQVFYQPKINTEDQSVCGAEALVRWFPKNAAPIMPNDFIPAAELSGDIVAIGGWVLDAVCAQIRDWKDGFNLSIPVAVNMSPIQIGREETIDLIQETLLKYRLSPDMLEIEITETASLLNSDLFARQLMKIHEIGCRITVDDFGIGYSSLLRFLDLPVSSLKIDQSFIAQINQSQKADAICKSIITLARNLNIPVTAEGVETSSQLAAIEDLECQYAQGFFIKEPVSAEHFMRWYANYRTSLSPHSSAYLN